jgi:hypothetical protein
MDEPIGRRVLLWGGIGVALVLFCISAEGLYRTFARARPGDDGDIAPVAPADVGDPLYESRVPERRAPYRAAGAGADPIIVQDCRLAVTDKQDVAGQRDGVLLFVGEEVAADVAILDDRLMIVRLGKNSRRIRRWKEGDLVRPGQVLAQIDDRLALKDWEIKQAKLGAARADLTAAEKTRDEAKTRYETQVRLRGTGRGATSEEEVRSARLNWDRYHYEALSKKEGLALAEKELEQAATVLEVHQVRATISGTIKTIYKQAGESVKSLEPVAQVQGTDCLRAEGLLDVKYRPRLAIGMKAFVEPAQDEGPLQTLVGHLQEVTAVAVTRDRKIVSASEDGTVRVWDRTSGREEQILRHRGAVRAVACTPTIAEDNLCLSGGVDGRGRLWDLSAPSPEPLRELTDKHAGVITCVAFSPDGRFCATGGEDRAIILWRTATGEILYRFPPGHRAAVSALQFTPSSQLISAGKDNTLRLWSVHERGAILEATFDRRAGEVTNLGAAPDGTQALFDQGQSLRILSLPEGRTEGVLRQSGGAARFTTFALFSPDGRLILTAGPRMGERNCGVRPPKRRGLTRFAAWSPPKPRSRPAPLSPRTAPLRSRARATGTCSSGRCPLGKKVSDKSSRTSRCSSAPRNRAPGRSASGQRSTIRRADCCPGAQPRLPSTRLGLSESDHAPCPTK